MNKKEIYMAGPSITDHEVNTVMDALKNGWYGKDAYYYVEKFEKEFSKYHDRKFALMTPNCTTALHLLLTGLGIKDDDEVIVPDCTWVGSVAGITYLRAKTIFADIDKNNWCLSAKTIEEKITEKTKAVIVVDLYGNMPNYKEIEKLCKDKNLFLIEDSAEALGSKYDGIRAGKFGIGSTFSFHRTKTITTGEGGMLLIDDEKLYDRCKFLRDHGRQPGTYFNTEITYKYMPFNVQAALGLAQFQRIDELVEKKRWIWNGFKERLSDIEDIYFRANECSVIFIDGLNREKALDYITKNIEALDIKCIVVDNSEWVSIYEKIQKFVLKTGWVYTEFVGFGPQNRYVWSTTVLTNPKNRVVRKSNRILPIENLFS